MTGTRLLLPSLPLSPSSSFSLSTRYQIVVVCLPCLHASFPLSSISVLSFFPLISLFSLSNFISVNCWLPLVIGCKRYGGEAGGGMRLREREGRGEEKVLFIHPLHVSTPQLVDLIRWRDQRSISDTMGDSNGSIVRPINIV